jgi:hypothetical protein
VAAGRSVADFEDFLDGFHFISLGFKVYGLRVWRVGKFGEGVFEIPFSDFFGEIIADVPEFEAVVSQTIIPNQRVIMEFSVTFFIFGKRFGVNEFQRGFMVRLS